MHGKTIQNICYFLNVFFFSLVKNCHEKTCKLFTKYFLYHSQQHGDGANICGLICYIIVNNAIDSGTGSLCNRKGAFICNPPTRKRLAPILYGDHNSTVINALCYKSESRWFHLSWCQWIFHRHKILPIALWPWDRLRV